MTTLDRVRRLAQKLGRTPTQQELRGLGIPNRRQREVLEALGLPLRPPKSQGRRTPRVATAMRQDALGVADAVVRLQAYRVPDDRRDTLDPLAGWMA